jgi:chemotaxis protein CheD
MTNETCIKVGMADLKAVGGRTGILRTTGLGSCVGLTLHDAQAGVSGMAHIMLPDSDIAREQPINVAKYADTAVPELIRQMKALGAEPDRLVAKMAGGAQMFAFAASETMRIGPRNVEAVKRLLADFCIPLVAEDTGEHYGRTIEFHCDTGILVVRSVQQGVKRL